MYPHHMRIKRVKKAKARRAMCTYGICCQCQFPRFLELSSPKMMTYQIHVIQHTVDGNYEQDTSGNVYMCPVRRAAMRDAIVVKTNDGKQCTQAIF